MPRRKQLKLPSRAGFCKHAKKDIYPDTISAGLALEYLSKNPPRGSDGPIRFYPCRHGRLHYHLTSQPQRSGIREIEYSG